MEGSERDDITFEEIATFIERAYGLDEAGLIAAIVARRKETLHRKRFLAIEGRPIDDLSDADWNAMGVEVTRTPPTQ